MRKRVLGAAVVSLISLAVAAPTSATFPGRNGKLLVYVHTYERFPKMDGYHLLDPDGTGVRKVPGGGRWSPDGTRIASVRVDGRQRAFLDLRRADGSLIRSTRLPFYGGDARWSPDGRWLALGGSGDVYVVRPDGTVIVNVTRSGRIEESGPSWSPDSKKLVFTADHDLARYGGGDGYVTNVDGTGERLLVAAEKAGWFSAGAFTWSPSGAQIAFTGEIEFGQPRAYVIREDGSGLAKLIDDWTGICSWCAGWSPDGTRLAFLYDPGDTVGEDDYMTTAIVDMDDRNEPLCVCVDTEGFTWSPDGKKFVYAAKELSAFSSFLVVSSADGEKTRTIWPEREDVLVWPIDWQPLGVSLPPPIVGTRDADRLRGTNGDDVLRAGAGDDRLWAGGGDDIAYGNSDSDVLGGGPGWDTLVGGYGDDTLFARDGRRDWVLCGPGFDRVQADTSDLVRDCESVQRA